MKEEDKTEPNWTSELLAAHNRIDKLEKNYHFLAIAICVLALYLLNTKDEKK